MAAQPADAPNGCSGDCVAAYISSGSFTRARPRFGQLPVGIAAVPEVADACTERAHARGEPPGAISGVPIWMSLSIVTCTLLLMLSRPKSLARCS